LGAFGEIRATYQGGQEERISPGSVDPSASIVTMMSPRAALETTSQGIALALSGLIDDLDAGHETSRHVCCSVNRSAAHQDYLVQAGRAVH
jgi:hypothetical protein